MANVYAGIYLSKRNLKHFGRLGQKHGVKNGPPYPLDYSKLSSEEKRLAKESAIKRGEIKEITSNINEFDNKEYEDILRRIDLKQKVSALDKSNMEKGMEKMSKIASYAGTVGDFVNKTSGAYNSIAKVINTFSNEELPIIGESRKIAKQYDSKTIEKMLKNPDNYSREDWKNVASLTEDIKKSKNNYKEYASPSLIEKAQKVAKEKSSKYNNTVSNNQTQKKDKKKKPQYTGQ